MKTNSIQAVVEVSLYDLQTDKARKMDITVTGGCAICGKPIKDETNAKYIHLLTNGNITSYMSDDIDNSQGCFPVGPECAKKLIVDFTTKLS